MSWWRKYSQSKQPLIQLSDTLQFILNELKNHGKSAYIVGGAVRDA
jgi:tRNA nucleotidyltransferase/poly(A) polymerase